jgi:hypothetical protein
MSIATGSLNVHPQIYLGHIPPTARERRGLRALALDLSGRIAAARAAEPTLLLLNFADAKLTEMIDLLLLRPNAIMVGAIRGYRGPIEASPNGRWRDRATGDPIHDQRGRTPLQQVRAQRDAVRDQIRCSAERLTDAPPGAELFERTIGAVIFTPSTHPESRISLDVTDHRQWLKVLGLDELPALAAMIHTDPHLSEQAMRVIATEVFPGRLWYDGASFLFGLAPARFQLRPLGADERPELVLPLQEGETIVGRRRKAQQSEHRLTLEGDDLISSNHVQISYGDDEWVTLRDTSKNGTWITPPGGTEERARGERAIVPGTVLRMGVTRLRLERADE